MDQQTLVAERSGLNFAVRLTGGVVGLALFTTLFTGRDGSVGGSAADFVDAFRLPMVLLAAVAAVGAVTNQALVKVPAPQGDAPVP